jgi:GTPase KRas protein
MDVFKLVVMGDGGVGKSSVTARYISEVFEDFVDPTLEDQFRKQVTIDDETALLEILDTIVGNPVYPLREGFIRTGQAFLLVYSITSRESFQYLDTCRNRIHDVKDNDRVPMVMIGNMSDLSNERVVSLQEAINLATEWRIPYLEVSAKSYININECFSELVRELRRSGTIKPPIAPKPKKTGGTAMSKCDIM